MTSLLALVVLAGAPMALAASPVVPAAGEVTSPDGRLTVRFELDSGGMPHYSVRAADSVVLQESRLGLVRDDADFSRGLTLYAASPVEPVRDRYEILTAKRRINEYGGHRRVFHLKTAAGRQMDVIFQVSNEGVAFQYFFPETSRDVRRVKEEVSSFHFPPGSRAWLQPVAAAKSGWSQVNPSYEELYEKDIAVGTPSPMVGWVFPALFRAGSNWVLVSETALGRDYCGSRLRPQSPDGEYSIGFPDPREGLGNGAVNPESTLPWRTPWRFMVVGSLKTIAESTLGIDLAVPATSAPATMPEPGKAAWSWPLKGDANTTFEVQRSFIDYAAGMGWRYCLIDGFWDQQIGYEKVKELVDYGRKRGVAILLWYNSAGDWNTSPQTPRHRMLTHESRVTEFARLKAMGVAGLKVDFFGGDGQSMIAYYHDILADAAPYGFLMNFHGATLPRGWQRTYPHLMTMEAVRGLEFATFEQRHADDVPSHATMLPFTRNAFDPMDFTPMVLDRIPRIERRTTSAFELALSILFTSGIQHYAEIPEGMATVPEYVRDLLRHVPSVWDDVRFLDGFPGRFVVLARRAERRWYVSAINGETTAREMTLDLGPLALVRARAGTLITDGEAGPRSFRRERVKLSPGKPLRITLAPQGGFILTIEP